MDFDTIPAAELGRSLKGVGINLLTGDVRGLAAFLVEMFELSVYRLSDDFAIIRHDGTILQLHADPTYGGHPLISLMPENPPRGAGAQFYLFGIDPDRAVSRANAAGHLVLEAAADKPHGLREATILSPEGYAFTPAVPHDT
ncbi:hypothetical protein roselon_01201 [Roseibacterium elongatum DSM 19469]|uniref:VOC domain-containing protein n=1 Tax=Roseicyclus elongatus DSM 19469 TaxID=1294273 RepID=W8S0D0_9RHOB|nr:glyoxalase/bleomycin resistance/dioxygenase family protein [Roseibacterium elongatum]AHM03592.1 hypothetical protein roselon_01201 [Roseibacterium elongatum DSM 19469]